MSSVQTMRQAFAHIFDAIMIAIAMAAISNCYAVDRTPRAAEYFSKESRVLFSTPERDIDTGAAALIFAREVYPSIDIATYSARIDDLVLGARRTVDQYGKYDSESVIRALNTFFYRVYGVKYDRSPSAQEKDKATLIL